MSLSAEALAQLDRTDLQELRSGSSFTSIAETRQAEAPDLSGKELADLRSLDFSGVTARLDGLTFAGRPPAPMPAPEAAAGSLAKAKEKIRNFLKSRKGQKTTISERAPEAAAREQAAKSKEEEVEEGLEGAVADSLAGAGGKMRRFFDSREGQEILAGAEFSIGGLVGVAVAEISKLDPAWEAGVVVMAQSALGLSRLGTELGAQIIEAAEQKFPRFAKLSAKLAGEKGLSGVLRSIKNLVTRIQLRPILMGFSVGIIGHSAFEMIAGHSIFPDVSAAETTVGGGIPEVQAPGGGEWPSESRFASSQPAAATEAPSGAVGGGISPADQPSPVEDWTDAAGAEPPAEAVGGDTEAPTATAGSESTATVGPTVTTEPTATGTEALPAAGAPEAALEAATRVVEVQSGDTLTDLVARAGGDPYGADFTNTVLQSADVLTGPQNPNRDMARALIEFIKAHPGGVNWRDAMNGVGDLAKEVVGGRPLKDAIAQATRMVYPGQMMKVVVGAAGP